MGELLEKFTMEKATMSRKRGMEHLVSERWPKLRERAIRETSPEKLIAVLEEIDDLLFNLEMRIAAQSGRNGVRDDAEPKSFGHESDAVSSGSPETEANE